MVVNAPMEPLPPKVAPPLMVTLPVPVAEPAVLLASSVPASTLVPSV